MENKRSDYSIKIYLNNGLASIPASDWPGRCALVCYVRETNNLLPEVIAMTSDPLDVQRVGPEVIYCELCIE